jgi:hypothetical protein
MWEGTRRVTDSTTAAASKKGVTVPAAIAPGPLHNPQRQARRDDEGDGRREEEYTRDAEGGPVAVPNAAAGRVASSRDAGEQRLSRGWHRGCVVGAHAVQVW